MKKINLLWIEDESEDRLSERRAILQTSLEFNCTVARNATEGEYHVTRFDFDVIIVDLRLYPGNSKIWQEYHNDIHSLELSGRLGLLLIKNICNHYPAFAKKMGIYTIERWVDIEKFILPAGITEKQYLKKKTNDTPEDFMNFVMQIYDNGNK